jgi:hypothetical protein
MTKFFASLSESSKQYRFFGLARPTAKMIDGFCDNSDPHKRLSLVVTRSSGSSPRIIATGNYVAANETTAEIAMAVPRNKAKSG